MPAASAISIDDGKATPVTHTFVPQQISPSESTFVDKDSVTSAGQKQLIIGFSPRSTKRSTDRVKVRLNMPIESTVDTVTAVAYTGRMSSDFVIPDQMTLAERTDFAALCANAISHAIIQGNIVDLEPVY
jgi:hypothetical protein